MYRATGMVQNWSWWATPKAQNDLSKTHLQENLQLFLEFGGQGRSTCENADMDEGVVASYKREITVSTSTTLQVGSTYHHSFQKPLKKAFESSLCPILESAFLL